MLAVKPNYYLINLVGEFLSTYKRFFSSVENSHAYRYVQIVSNSEVGHNCRYAKASLKLWNLDQRTEQIRILRDMRAGLDAILTALEDTEVASRSEDSNEGS